MLTAQDLKALAAYLRQQEQSHLPASRLATLHSTAATAAQEAAEAEQLAHWAAGIQDLAEAKALAAVEAAPACDCRPISPA